MAKRRVLRKWLCAVSGFLMTVFLAAGAGAQDFSRLDRALGKPDPSGELLANFNELVASAANIGAVPPTDQDRAEADRVRALLQDPAGIARAQDQAARAAAQSSPVFQQIPTLAMRLDQAIGDRLSSDARTGMSNDFKAVAEYMAIVAPSEAWYCIIRPVGSLVGC
jgi:hypothetical protein